MKKEVLLILFLIFLFRFWKEGVAFYCFNLFHVCFSFSMPDFEVSFRLFCVILCLSLSHVLMRTLLLSLSLSLSLTHTPSLPHTPSHCEAQSLSPSLTTTSTPSSQPYVNFFATERRSSLPLFFTFLKQKARQSKEKISNNRRKKQKTKQKKAKYKYTTHFPVKRKP